jgi:hypothetical protein
MKSIMKFTLILKNVHENTSHLEDSLYEAGCDDSLISFRSGAVYLDFDREALTLEDAVISAINDVNSSSIGAQVASVAPENLVTESEIAKRLNTNRQTVSLWIKGERRKSFPHPVMRLAEKSPLWNWNEVIHWLNEKKIITDMKLVEEANFLANINAALEERDSKTRKMRKLLREKIENQYSQRHHL